MPTDEARLYARAVDRVAWPVVVLGLLVACKPVSSTTDASRAETVAPADDGVPTLKAVALPTVEGELPPLPVLTRRVTLRADGVDVDGAEVASTRGGDVTREVARAVVEALTGADAARPVALEVDAAVSAGAAVALMNAVRSGGAQSVGFVLQTDAGPGWFPMNPKVLEQAGGREVRLSEDANFKALSEALWARSDQTQRLVVAVHETMTAQALFAGLLQLRGPSCVEPPKDCRFSSMMLTLPGSPSKDPREGVYLPAGDEGTIGLGNVGTIGDGRPAKAVPRVRVAKPTVSQGLEADIVRRIVRAHINEVRHCYNRGLVDNPDLAGRVTVEFTVPGDGKVSAAAVDTTTLPKDDVEKCIVKAVKRWRFPKPTGGVTVVVKFPFVLEPG